MLTPLLKNYNRDNPPLYRRDDPVNDLDKKHNNNSEQCKDSVINREELDMLCLMRDILDKGHKRNDRTNVGNLSLFSRELRFDLSRGHIPMMTTRPLSLRIIFEELMWILRGQTDNKILNKKKIKIWDYNTNREFLYKVGLFGYSDGDIGASYGFQLRHFGANYKGCDKKYDDMGFDQLEYVIYLLKNNPESRRILMNLWNPKDLHKMSLPPCLYGYQFYIADNKLSCKLIQRSSDISLAGSHNCASGALLVRLLCKVTGLSPGELIWSPSDIHIYLNQVESVKEQLKREPREFPLLRIINSPKDNNIRNFEYKDIELIGYKPHPRINFAMNA